MFETLTLDAAIYIARNMRPENRDSMLQGLPDMSPEAFAINRWQTDGAAWALFQDGTPVAMGGIAMTLPWLGVAWFVVAEGITRDSWKKMLRFSRTVFANARKTIPRIEAQCVDGWAMAEKYAKSVGFQYEFTRERAARDGRGIKSFVILGESA